MLAVLRTERTFNLPLATILALLAVFAAGLELRVQSVRLTIVDGPIRADAKDYVSYALNLAHFGVYSRGDGILRGETAAAAPDALRSPGYPLFLAAILGDNPPFSALQTVLLVQAFLSALTVLICYFLLRTMVTWPWAIVGAALTALSPHLITMSVYLLTETLFAFLLAASMFAVIWAHRQRSAFAMAIAGALLGAGALTRPSLEYLLIPMAIFVFVSLRVLDSRVAKRLTVMLVLGFSLTYLPWIVRNEITLGRTGDRTLMINTLHHGLYPDFRYNGDPATFGYPYRFDPRASEIAASLPAVLGEIAARFRAAPAEYLRWYLIGKPWMFWSWTMAEGPGDVFVYPVKKTPYVELPHFSASHGLMRILHIPLLLLAFVGSVLVWLPQRVHALSGSALFAARLVSLVLWYFTVLHMVGAPFPRYSVPLRPFMFAAALIPVWALWQRAHVFLPRKAQA